MKRHASRVADLLNPAAVLLPAANVIMQLSLPGVGYGVLESPVDSGNVYKHPFKRARTTGTYLAVATIGTESDRELIRAAVDTAHRQVRVIQPFRDHGVFGPGVPIDDAAGVDAIPAAPVRVTAGRAALADRLIPHRVWILGYRLYLWDMRFRARRGWRIV